MKTKLGIAALIVLICAIGLNIYHRRKAKDAAAFAPTLRGDEREKIIVDTNSHTVTRISRQGAGRVGGSNAGGQDVRTVSSARRVAISIDKNGTVSVYAPTKGAILEPGFATAYSEDRIMLGIDSQVFYWNKLGLNVGITSPIQRPYRVRAYVCGSYEVYGNTSLFLGVTHTKQAIFGVRIKF